MTALANILALALLHFVWQGTLVAVLLWMALFAARRRSANLRYGLSCAALATLLALPAVTACLLYPRAAPGPGVALTSFAAPPVAPTPPAHAANWLLLLQAWAVPVWCAGVFFFSARLVWGSRQVRLMRRRGEPAEEALRILTTRLADRIGLNRRVEILISSLAAGPSVVGILRPVILLPASAMLGLTPEQLEGVLAHELAHIRRYDYLVNVLQMSAEALLFYHPAVWWTSGRIRRERELCCDDEAVRVCGDSFCYARALTALERIRIVTPTLALGGTDGPLAFRIKRLMGVVPDENLPSKLAGVVAVCLALLGLGLSANRVRAQAQPDAAGVQVDLGGSKVIHRDPVSYPPAAQIKSVTGTVSVEVHLDATGNVSDARVLSGPDDLRKPVLQSVLGWHFSPDAAGSTRVVNVEFQSPSQANTAAPAAGGDKGVPVDEVLDRFKENAGTAQFLKAELDRAKANLAQAQMRDQNDNRVQADMRAREAELRAMAEALQAQARSERTQNPAGMSFVTVPTHPEPMVLPPPVAQRFEGRTLRTIRLSGIGVSTDDFLSQAQLPIREGDALTQSSIEATISAVRRFDEHLAERWTTVEPNSLDLTIFVAPTIPVPGGRGAAPAQLQGRGAGGGNSGGVGGGIGGGVGGGNGAGVGAGIGPAQAIEAIEFRGARRIPGDILRTMISEKAGDVYDEQAARRDLQVLWNTKRFDDIQVKTDAGTHGGTVVWFVVTERQY